MKKEKIYCIPEFIVIELDPQNDVIRTSGEEEDDVYGDDIF